MPLGLFAGVLSNINCVPLLILVYACESMDTHSTINKRNKGDKKKIIEGKNVILLHHGRILCMSIRVVGGVKFIVTPFLRVSLVEGEKEHGYNKRFLSLLSI